MPNDLRKPLFQVFSGKRRKHAITTNVEYRSSGAIQNKHTPSTSLKKTRIWILSDPRKKWNWFDLSCIVRVGVRLAAIM